MLTRRTIILGIAGAAIGTPVLAADTSARGFVAGIYDKYKGANGNGVPLENEKVIHRYFEPSLAALISKDQKEAAKRNETSTLDFDPFIDAQDWDIANLDIAVADAPPDKATATVKFKNRDTQTTVLLDLVKVNKDKIKNEWRISDITWQHDGKTDKLSALFVH